MFYEVILQISLLYTNETKNSFAKIVPSLPNLPTADALLWTFRASQAQRAAKKMKNKIVL